MVKVRAIERRKDWKEYNVFQNKEIILDGVNIGYFLNWIEDMPYFEDFLLTHNYTNTYGIKKITHELRRFELTTKPFNFLNFYFVPVDNEKYEDWAKRVGILPKNCDKR